MPPPPDARVPPPTPTIEPKPPAPRAEPARTSGPAPAAPAPSGAEDAGALWSRVLAAAGDRPSALARLESMSLARLEGSLAFVRPATPAHASRVRNGITWIEERLTEAAGRRIRVRIEEPSETDGAAISGDDETAAPIDEASLRREARGNKLVETAMDLFQAKLIRVEAAPPPAPSAPPADTTGEEP